MKAKARDEHATIMHGMIVACPSLALFTEEEDAGESGFWQFHIRHCNSVLYHI